jgi:hypothetical protein
MWLSTDRQTTITAADITQWHAAILGMTGSGKTNTLYVFAEELSRNATKVTVIDPEGDYGALRNAGAIVVGQGRRGNQVDVPLDPTNAAAAADILARHDAPLIVVDLSGFDLDERDAFVLAYLGQIWKAYQFEDLPAHRLIIDEVQIFAPQGPMTASKKLLLDLAARARKRNLTLALATQRPQSVDKGLLDATRLRILHRIARGRALKAVKDLLPDTPDAEDVISGLKTGQAILMLDNEAQVLQIRASEIFNPTSAPEISEQPRFDSAALDALKALIASDPPITEDLDLEVEVQRLRAENSALRSENERLNKQLASGFQIALPLPEASVIAPTISGASITVAQRDKARLGAAEERDLRRQQKRFDVLLNDIGRAKPMHQRLLSYLVDHEPDCFDAQFLARITGVTSDRFKKNPPTELMKLGLIKRVVQGSGKFLFQSQIGDLLARECPDLDLEFAKEQIAALGE